MSKILGMLLFLFLIPSKLKSQIQPGEGCKLHYRLIGFSFPAELKHVSTYKLEIAKGYYNSEDSFKKNIVKTLSSKENKIIAEVPFFGCQYTWRVIYAGKHTNLTITHLYHFSTLIIPNVDTNNTRLRIMHVAEKYKDAFVFLDGTKTLYDMNGHPVWFVPDIEGSENENIDIRDLKATHQYTITYLNNVNIYEINYNGNILWKGPKNGNVSGDSTEHYHHEFTRLQNGHYMVLGMEYVLWNRNLPFSKDSNSLNIPNAGINNKTVGQNNWKSPFGTIIEYNEKGNVVWSWKSSQYFMTSDIMYYKDTLKSPFMDVHDNSFCFDEDAKVIYVSYKKLSRIIKIKYPEGTVINTYGEIYKPGVPIAGNGLFCGQHAIRHSQTGCIFLFNNNDCNNGQPPKIKRLKEPNKYDEQIKKIWEYECTIEGNYPGKFHTGGNVLELPDQSIFVCMGSSYCKIFIVSPDKKILWSALPEKWNPSEKKWNVCSQYRASIITSRKELEHLIWNEEK